MRAAWSEAPLIGFTGLAILGAGIPAAALLAMLGGVEVVQGSGALPMASCLFLAGGMAVSLSHLGRPGRAALALLRPTSSPLSREVVFASLCLLAGGTAIFGGGSGSELLWFLWGACGFLLLLALGDVYDLPAQPAWRGAVVRIPATQGLAFGFLTLAGWETPWADAMVPAAVAFLALDLLLHLVRARQLNRLEGLEPASPFRSRQVRLLMAGQALVGAVLPLLLLPLAGVQLATLFQAVGVGMDRVLFYLMAAAHSQEAEVRRVEEIIGDL